MLGTAPPEILTHILTYADNNVLISLSSTSRYLNASVIPLLYQHTDLDIWITDNPAGSYDLALAALRGLAGNTQGQCQYVKRLSIRNKRRPWASSPRDRQLFESLGAILEDGIVLQSPASQVVEYLLESALPQMRSLLHLDWLVGISSPGVVLSALGSQLQSLNCDALWLYKIPAVYSEPSIPKLCSLTSLCVTGMVGSQTPSFFPEILAKCGPSLKHFKLQSVPPHWSLDLPPQSQDKHLLSQLEHLAAPGELIKLESLELLLLNTGPSGWYRYFDFQSLTTLTIINEEQSSDDDIFFDHLRKSKVRIKGLYTNMYSHSMARYISLSGHLEEFIFPAKWLYIKNALPDLSGHFGSLRSLFLEDIIPPLLRGEHALEYLRLTISNCRVLEQLAFNMSALDTRDVWKVLSTSPTLKRFFILICRDSPWDLQVPAGHILRDLLIHFNSEPSPFLERLELFGCFQSLWSFEPIALTRDEEEELDYELTSEDISDDELRDLGIDIAERQAPPPPRTPSKDVGDEEDDDEDLGFDIFDSPTEPSTPESRYIYNIPPQATPYLKHDGKILVTHRLLEEPYCYSWERVVSGYPSVPMRVEWDEYEDDRFVCAVRDFVKRYAWSNPRMKTERPERDIDWEEDDEGWDCFPAREWARASIFKE